MGDQMEKRTVSVCTEDGERDLWMLLAQGKKKGDCEDEVTEAAVT